MAARRVAAVFRAIAYYEILGAGWSVLTISRIITHSPGVLIPWPWLVLIIGFYALVWTSGILLLRHHELGELLSLITQGLQVLQVTIGPVAFRFLAGLQASVFFLGNRVTYYLGITASVNLWRAPNDVPFAIGVNLVPLVILVIFARFPSPAAVARALENSQSFPTGDRSCSKAAPEHRN